MENDNLCVICLSEIDINKKNNYKLTCGHTFHTECIIDWFRSSNGHCPCCFNNDSKKIPFYGLWGETYINNRCNRLISYSKKNLVTNSKRGKLSNQIKNLNKKKEEYKSLIQERKSLKQNDEYQLMLTKMKNLNKNIYNKERSIMNMKIKIISNYPTVITL